MYCQQHPSAVFYSHHDWRNETRHAQQSPCLSYMHISINDSATPVLKASAFNIVSCSKIRQYETPTSHFLGQRILVLTSGINSYVCLPLLSQSHLHGHDVWAIYADILYASAMDMFVGASTFPLTIFLAAILASKSTRSLSAIPA